ncbi:similar to Saccharomyces cerevisiae YDL040C NAT1 Subunit of the N-terminal acetyltransferase NatA (Nat1p, Ard1p, Nat5p) [Maudiozyma saulgeensis]|uniref:Similar to Saccharomyces cerevisiae YDL040C NAT1 Subunit of the N-terminal acetyltransferase NatA (Nat1p, Ard1p, Nat5p) n=1 Tax=Maudiozyma saulgeensis TaxID=1789683 RepID=A0A1X7R3U9_9SACH|nr:similar to Saccharomyces cerevisiae YDL040C NAT1 Subunit of the N-terminal acetyltransferase NatA (Nat1p, Ard1p, Nat5p) [Kazachstania saulgeensis]
MSRRRVGGKPKPAAKAAAGKDHHTQFLEALKLYEGKQYKKSIKLLETIMKKQITSEFLALKGLNHYFLGEKEEASDYIGQAINKIEGTKATAICCHLLGIYKRSVKEYNESIKWFQASLDNGSTNKQIYRDLATLQSHVGDFKAALVSRKKYWESFVGYRANWTALAVAQDINGERQQAVNTLSQFEKLAQGKISEAEMYEHNECLIYKNDIMYKAAGDNPDKLKNVLHHLEDIEPNVFDKFGLLERKASIYMKLGQTKEASLVYRTLIKRNPDDFKYYKLLEVSLGITTNNKLRKVLYEKLASFYPRCEAPKFLPLTFIHDEEELTKKLGEYVLPQLKRGVPAAFSNVKPLYLKRRNLVPKLLEKIVIQYLSEQDSREHPIPYIWCCYFLSQHYLNLRDYQKAQEYIEKAIEHTPTMVEFYLMKARILKHTGELEKAASIVEEGRKLDLQDRFINCKGVKYYLRANQVDKAVEVASLFTKNDDSVNGVKDLHLVEASWFISEQAEAYYRMHISAQKKLDELRAETASSNEDEITTEIKDLEWSVQKYKGLSLKRFYAISKFYKQFEDDQLDFHSYCMRKGTPRAYLEMLNAGQRLYTQPMYVRAMNGASKIYFNLYDNSLKRKQDVDVETTTLPGGDKKKAKKEAASLAKRKGEEKKQVLAYSETEDQDVFGEELLATETPLASFSDNFYENYNKQAKDYERNHILDFEYQYRNGKLALCLGALSKFEKRHGQKSGLFGAMAITLLLATKESSSVDMIAKKVAMKGLETDYSFLPLKEVENESFDWLTYFKENFNSHDLNALVFLKQTYLFEDGRVNEMILSAISHDEPLLQNYILQYVL